MLGEDAKKAVEEDKVMSPDAVGPTPVKLARNVEGVGDIEESCTDVRIDCGEPLALTRTASVLLDA
jgi:hypothetical protein